MVGGESIEVISRAVYTPASVINISLACSVVIIGLVVYLRRKNNLSAGLFLLL